MTRHGIGVMGSAEGRGGFEDGELLAAPIALDVLGDGGRVKSQARRLAP